MPPTESIDFDEFAGLAGFEKDFTDLGNMPIDGRCKPIKKKSKRRKRKSHKAKSDICQKPRRKTKAKAAVDLEKAAISAAARLPLTKPRAKVTEKKCSNTNPSKVSKSALTLVCDQRSSVSELTDEAKTISDEALREAVTGSPLAAFSAGEQLIDLYRLGKERLLAIGAEEQAIDERDPNWNVTAKFCADTAKKIADIQDKVSSRPDVKSEVIQQVKIMVSQELSDEDRLRVSGLGRSVEFIEGTVDDLGIYPKKKSALVDVDETIIDAPKGVVNL